MKIEKKEPTKIYNNLSNYRVSISKRRFKKKRFIYKLIKRRRFIRGSKLILGTLSKRLICVKLSGYMAPNLDSSFKYGDVFVNYGSSSIRIKGAKSSLKLDIGNPVCVNKSWSNGSLLAGVSVGSNYFYPWCSSVMPSSRSNVRDIVYLQSYVFRKLRFKNQDKRSIFFLQNKLQYSVSLRGTLLKLVHLL